MAASHGRPHGAFETPLYNQVGEQCRIAVLKISETLGPFVERQLSPQRFSFVLLLPSEHLPSRAKVAWGSTVCVNIGLHRGYKGSHWGYIGVTKGRTEVTKGRTYSIVTLWFGVWVYAK